MPWLQYKSFCLMCPRGRLMFVQSMFLLLLLFVMSSALSSQLWQWLISKDVIMSWQISYTQGAAPSYLKDNTDGSSKNVPAPGILSASRTKSYTCEFPHVNLYEPSVVKIAGLNKTTIRCEGFYLPELTYITDDSKITVNKSKVREYMNMSDLQHCRYRQIFGHETNADGYIYGEWSKPFKDLVELPKDAEFLKVECTNLKFEVVSKTFHSLIPRKEQFDSVNLMKRQVISSPKETLNVIMIGMGTLSRLQFLRACNKTYSYLMNTLASYDLTMHSQFGGDTFSNVLPLFTGHTAEDVKKRCFNYSYIDSFDLIWRAFENAGYRMLFTQDKINNGAFLHLFKGCFNFSVMYNMRPLTLAMYRNIGMYKRKYYCAGNQVDMNIHLDYIRGFLDKFPDKPLFAVALLTKPTQKDPSSAKMFDDHLLHFYESLNHNGHLNRSVILSFSDHGVKHGELRGTINGHAESKTPYTILTFPGWFLKKYPDIATNLQTNSKRLTSHLDTHATLLDLLYFKNNPPPSLAPRSYGISLLKKIPSDRTCKDALIPPEYCLCGYTYLEDVYATSQLSTMLVKLVVAALNSKTDKQICAVFTLKLLNRIQKIALDDYHSKGTRSTIVYKVKLEVNPGNAIFEASVYEHNQFNDWDVGDDIARLNNYRGQSECLHIEAYRPFCYCRNLLPEEWIT